LRSAIVLAVLIAIGYALHVQQKKQQREAEITEIAREAAAEEMYKRQDERVRAQRESFHQQAKEKREEDVRRNAPERDRISTKYPDLYRNLAMKAGGDLNSCVVTAREDQTMVVLYASCGESLQEAINSSSK